MSANIKILNVNESIGDSLSAIQSNFSCFDISTCNLEWSANNQWNWMKTNSQFPEYNQAYREVKEYHEYQWNNMSNIVANSSAHWFTPVMMIYPFPQVGLADPLVGKYDRADLNRLSLAALRALADTIPVDSTGSRRQVTNEILKSDGSIYTRKELNRLTTAELQELAVADGLSAVGTRANLIDRFLEVDRRLNLLNPEHLVLDDSRVEFLGLNTSTDNPNDVQGGVTGTEHEGQQKISVTGSARPVSYAGLEQQADGSYIGQAIGDYLCQFGGELSWEGVTRDQIKFTTKTNNGCDNGLPSTLQLSRGPNQAYTSGVKFEGTTTDAAGKIHEGEHTITLPKAGSYELVWEKPNEFRYIIKFEFGISDGIKGDREAYTTQVRTWLNANFPPANYPVGYRFMIFVPVHSKDPLLHTSINTSLADFGPLTETNNVWGAGMEVVTFVKEGRTWKTNPQGGDSYSYKIPVINEDGCSCFGPSRQYDFNCVCLPRPVYYRLTCNTEIINVSLGYCMEDNLALDNFDFANNINSLRYDSTYQNLSSTAFTPYLIGLSGNQSLVYNPDDFTVLQGNQYLAGTYVGFNYYINDYQKPVIENYTLPKRHLDRQLLYEYSYDGSDWDLSTIYEKTTAGYTPSITATNFFDFPDADMEALVTHGGDDPEILLGCEFSMFIDTSWFAWSVSGTPLADERPYWFTDNQSGLSSWYGNNPADRMGKVTGVSLISSTDTYPGL